MHQVDKPPRQTPEPPVSSAPHAKAELRRNKAIPVEPSTAGKLDINPNSVVIINLHITTTGTDKDLAGVGTMFDA